MPEHDPLCEFGEDSPITSRLEARHCRCDLIAQVREDERERKPTEAVYDIVLGKCRCRGDDWLPHWCATHDSGIHQALHCDRRLVLQNTVEHALKTMEAMLLLNRGEDR